MQQQLRLVVAVLAFAFAITAVGTETETQDAAQRVTLADLPAAARATVEKWLDGGTIKKIDKEIEDGKVVYDVEAKVKGKHREITVAEDGEVLGTEEEVTFDSLPKAVREAVEKYFGSDKELLVSKEIEGSKTYYEVEGKKGDNKVELKLDDAGNIIEEEKE